MPQDFRPSMFDLPTGDRYASAIEGLEPDLDSVVLLPVRATSDAVLEGFEVRWCPSASRSPLRTEHAQRCSQCAPLAPGRLERVLSSKLASYLDELELRLWIPLPAEVAACRRVVSQLAGWSIATGFNIDRLTFVLPPSPGPDEAEALKECAFEARRAGAKVALDTTAARAALDTEDVSSGPYGEVRIAGICGAGREVPLLRSHVARWRKGGLLVSALHIEDSAQCEQAIRADVQFIQGDFVGLALPLRAVAARAASMSQFSATLL